MPIRNQPQFRGIDLRAGRTMAGLTQAELGSLLGVSAHRIRNVERAVSSKPSDRDGIPTLEDALSLASYVR